MEKTILKSIYVSNFGPFADMVEFTLEAEKGKKEYIDNLIFKENYVFNKVSYIYGANGAGKSYFCKIIRQIQSIILLSPILASGNTQLIDSLPLKELSSEIPTFRFSKAYEDSPTLFGISLMHKSVSYTYEFSIKNGIIISERLQKKFRRTETILERVSPSYLDISLKSELSSFLPNISVVKEDVLCLSMAAFLNNSLANELVSAIREIKVLNMATIKAGFNISEEAFSRDRIVKYLKVLQKADPTMDDLEVSFKDKKVERQKFSQDDFENREVIRETAKLSIESSHKIFLNGEVVDYVKMPFLQTESSGTIKLFIILPHLFEILETGGTLVLDEIENGLHPILVKELISLFNNQKTNPNNSQLICTSHDLTLIEDGVRRDQVWIICKNDMGVSSIKRVSKLLSMRGKVNLKQKYIEGAFGKIPQNFFKQ